MNHKRRLREARLALAGCRVDALLVTHLPNIRYLCGFTGSAGMLVITDQENALFTDGRYTQQAREEVQGAKIRIGRNSMSAASERFSRCRSIRRIGVEAEHMTVAQRNVLAQLLPAGRKIVAQSLVVERLRMVKDPEETSKIRAACRLGVELFDRLRRVAGAGVPESEIAAQIEFAARQAGAEQMAFPTIIASGSRSALPHGRASPARLPARGFVVCDFGVILAGYCSDMTRTLHVGRPSQEARAGYEAVREAQQAAVEAVKPGASVGEVDQAARNALSKRGLSKFFTHSTGHGLGLEIHEAPRVGADQSELLRPGMVITIEPGIYLPGKWGVRIEDTVVVTEKGCDILTSCPKDLIAL